jgi:hypothetical protein
MVRKNKSIGRGHIAITPELIIEIAQMSRENNVQKNNSKKSTSKRKYTIEDRDIHEIVALVQQNKKNKTVANAFTVERTHTNRRFGYNEYIYDVAIGANKASTLPDFLNNLREVFSYLINIMKYIASSDTDKARFYISKAPRTAFSTAVLNVSDFNVQMFFDIFERHMQSNAQEVIDNGWSCTISLFIFPNSYVPTNKSKTKKKATRLHKYVGKRGSDFGRGRKRAAKKHGREVRHGVFQITGTSNRCFALALLVGSSFLDKDKHSDRLNIDRNIPLDELYCEDEIAHIYAQCGLKPREGVRVDQLHLAYENILSSRDVDLVVFSKQAGDTIVYDSRLDDSGLLHRITNNVIFLWLNDEHYDLILSPYTFSKINCANYCFSCMRYFHRWEKNGGKHVCTNVYTCRNCYTQNVCKSDPEFFQQCTECFVNFKNRDCFVRHLTKKIFVGKTEFKGGKKIQQYITPCKQMFFCKTCYKKVPRKMTIKNKKNKSKTRPATAPHNCDMIFCKHCNAVKEKTHECFIKICKTYKNPTWPTLYFFDFETRKNSDGYMVPFYAVVQKVCHECDEKPFEKTYDYFLPHPDNYNCDIAIEPVPCCGYRQYVFEKNNACITKEFVDFMYAQPKNSVWVAHNGGRFDTVFLLRELLVERKIVPQCI